MTRQVLNTIAALLLVGLLAPAAAEAGSVTVMWDANQEPDLAGYVIRWGTQPGTYTSFVDVGNRTTWTIESLQDGTRYYFVLQAYNLAGLHSEYSVEVSAVVTAAGITLDDWKRKFAIDDMNADEDGDGVDNPTEYNERTDPTVPNRWHLAEGSTGFFVERLALANPGTVPARVNVTFLRESAPPLSHEYTIDPESRLSVNVNEIPELAQTTVSTVVSTLEGGVVAERTMFWSNQEGVLYAGHTGKGVQSPLTRWYFAEGDANAFDTWLLFGNANAFPVTLSVTYMPEGRQPIQATYTVAASARMTIYTNTIAGLRGRSFSTKVEASAPVTAERAMYMSNSGKFWRVGHGSAGVAEPSTSWYVAEGCTAWLFDEFLLLNNPNTQATVATIRYLLPGGQTITRNYSLAAQSRTTIWVDGEPGLARADVSAAITAPLPIVVERAMYWPAGNWQEGHASAGVTQAGTRWALAEGENGGPLSAETYVLLANPSADAASVKVTILPSDGSPSSSRTYTVPANSRFTLGPDQFTAGGRLFGTVVESVNAVPIVVERSLYWNALGMFWAGGTNETGVRLR